MPKKCGEKIKKAAGVLASNKASKKDKSKAGAILAKHKAKEH